MSTPVTIIILGLAIIILGICIYRGLKNTKLYKLLLPEVGTIAFITVTLLIINYLGLLFDISLNKKLDQESTLSALSALSIVEGITTAYVFFGMASFTEKKGFDVWVILLSTKIVPIFFTIASYIIILLLWTVSDLTIIFFIIIILYLLVTGLKQTINFGLYPSSYKDFKEKFEKRLYTDSLSKQKEYKSAISAFLNFVFNSKVYNLSLFSPTKELKTICFLLKKGDEDLFHFNPEEFRRFLQQMEKLLNNYSISLYKNPENKAIDLKESESNSFNLATVRLFYPYQKSDYLIEISTEDNIDIPKISSAQKWNLERVLRRAFSFNSVIPKSSSIGITDINSLFEQYIKAIKDENSITIESINEQILFYYTNFWDFLTKENYQYTVEEANVEFNIFSEPFAWKEITQLLNHTYKSFCLSSISKDPFVKKAGRELPLRILYQSHKRQDILTFSKVASWYFIREYYSIIESGDIADIRSLLLNLKELFYPYSDYFHKYFDFQKEVQNILLNQYLILAKISIEKKLPENLDVILEHLFNITDFSDEIEDIDIGLNQESDENEIEKMKKHKSYFLSFGIKANQISFCLTSWAIKNNLNGNIKKVLFKYLPKTDNQLLRIYLDKGRESLGVEDWDIEYEIGKNLTVKDFGMDFFDKRVFLEQFLRLPYKENSLKFENIRFEEQRLSYATYIFKLDEIVKNLEKDTFSYQEYGYATKDKFEDVKRIKIESLNKLIDEIKYIEQSEIGEREIKGENRKILFKEFCKSYKSLIKEPISLDYLFKNILKKDILFESGEILSSNQAFGFNEFLNKDNFFDDGIQYLHELGELFAEGFIDGETNQFVKEISTHATEIDLEKITPEFIKNKNFILIVTRPAMYKLHLQKDPSIEFVYNGNGSISGKMKVGKKKINIYELHAKEDKFLLFNTSTKGFVKRITTSNEKNVQGIFNYSLEFFSESDALTAEFMQNQPQWLLEKDMSKEEKILYLKTMAVIKIYERLDFTNFETTECYSIRLDVKN